MKVYLAMTKSNICANKKASRAA